MNRNFVMAAALALVAVGCGNEASMNGEMDTIDEVTKADSNNPSGYYQNTAPKLGELATVTLNDDHTYSRHFMMVDCIPLKGCEEKGTYKFSHSSTTRYIRFYDADGNFLDRYAYKLSGTALSLRLDSSSKWMSFKSYASLGQSCGGFVANVRQCEPDLICKYTGVPDVPGKCVKPNACQAAGGACVALSPGSCQGEVGDANEFSCGGGLGVECCFSN